MSESVFQEVKLGFKGEEYTIPPDRVMGAIAVVEEHVTFADLVDTKRPKLARIAQAFGALLRYAGAKVEDDVVYSAMFDGKTGVQIQNAISGLLEIMVPPEHLQKKTEGNKASRAKRQRKK